MLNNKVALITGAASGIGEQCAKTLALKGVKVVIADMNLDGAQIVTKDIIDAGGQASAVSMNVTNEDEVNAGIKSAVDRFGRLET